MVEVRTLPPEEMSFWLGILRDHAVFIRDNLGPLEHAEVRRADEFRQRFEGLRDRSMAEAVSAAQDLINFKRELLRRQVECRLTLHLEPGDLNQMVNEAEEFLRTAGLLPEPAGVAPRLLHLHRLWLWDAAAHSSMIYRTSDPYERILNDEMLNYERVFNGLFLRAEEESQILRKIGQPFNAVVGLTNDAQRVVTAHIASLERVEGLITRCEALTAAAPLSPNHMLREERHYLREIARAASGA
jgi:hypothetical protein